MRCWLPGVARNSIPLLIALIWPAGSLAGDWPMWRYDAGHTAASPDDLPGELRLEWVRQYPPRQPVWDDPLNQDMMPYDRIFEPVVAAGRMFLAFNEADKVVALDARDGSELWTFFTDGPVRFSPVVYEDAVLVASDDGCLYCLRAADGGLRWRFRGGPSERKIIGNGRVISSWPARGGPVAAGGTVYFAASIWPLMGTFIYALDAATGQVRWVNDGTSADYQKQPHSAPAFAGVAPQGQLAVSGDLLLVPGGRTLPAAFDRHCGELKFFNFGNKGEGGSFVAAEDGRAFVHTRRRGTMALDLPGGGATKLRVNEPVLARGVLYTARDGAKTGKAETPPTIEAYSREHRKLWEIAADGRGDLIRAGGRLYAAGAETITAIDLPEGDEKPRIAWSLPAAGQVVRLLAAANRLFAVTLDGRILAFGAEPGEVETIADPPRPSPLAAEAAAEAEKLLAATGQRQGYALWFGVDDGQLLEAVARASELHLVAVDERAEKIAALRRRLDRAGLYGTRIALAVGDPERFMAPPYIANLVVISRSIAPRLGDPRILSQVFESVRPYGGRLWAPGGEQLAAALAAAKLPGARLEAHGANAVITRQGPLPGAADWTHLYGDVANTVKSNDRRVKLPLGVLWFGGISNLDILPRHGHGPSQQVVGGRLFIQGINCLSALDVYTGRVLWKREFPDLGTFQVYYDETYAETPLSTAYNQVHLPGANARGTNFVAVAEGVYLVIGGRCLLLDAARGETLREFVLPEEGGQSPDWGYIGVYEDLLLAGVGFADYSKRLGYEYEPAGKRGLAWSPDRSASRALMAFDRHSGEPRWRVPADQSFLHNGIVAGGGRIYLLDKLPKRVEEQNRRRGDSGATGHRLLAIAAETGEPLWQSGDAFGTWLSYAGEHDLLIQAGSAAADRSPDEVGKGMAVYRAGEGSVVWHNAELSYVGPCMIHGDALITNATSYRESKGAFQLADGSPVTVADPVTGEQTPWRFVRTYGCNTAVASEHLLTFRSGAAGFYDLASHSGTGNFGGFKSGCSSNLIIADGVLSAPDYTRTCTCAYQNQTSLALVPMPENEIWTYNLFGQPGDARSEVRRIGINLGAPGDRLADNGTLWVNHPPDDGSSPHVPVEIGGESRPFCGHSARIAGDLAWVAASGVEGLRQLTVRLVVPAKSELGAAEPESKPEGEADQSAAAAAPLPATVRLVFSEPDPKVQAGERVFDVALQGKVVIRRLDVVAKAEGPLRSLVETCSGVLLGDRLQIELVPHGNAAPILCGVEVIRP